MAARATVSLYSSLVGQMSSPALSIVSGHHHSHLIRQLSSLLALTQPVLDPLARLLDDGPHHALRDRVEVLHLTASTLHSLFE